MATNDAVVKSASQCVRRFLAVWQRKAASLRSYTATREKRPAVAARRLSALGVAEDFHEGVLENVHAFVDLLVGDDERDEDAEYVPL